MRSADRGTFRGRRRGAEDRRPGERSRDGFPVEDDGPGISEVERDDVFEPGVTTQEDGDGLGLASVAQIVAALGLRVRATGGIDGGARFEITGVESP